MNQLFVVDSSMTKEAIAVGRRHHRRFRPVRLAEPIEAPTYDSAWWYIPLAEETSIIPGEALKSVDILKRNGFSIKQIIVAHESPLLLPPPAGESAREKREKSLRKMGDVAGQLAVLAVAVLSAVVKVTGFAILLGLGLLTDPAVIAVIEDEHGQYVWIEVAAWYD